MEESYSDGYSIKELLYTVRTHIPLLLIVFFSVIVLCGGYLLVKTPTYTATATIAIEPLANLVALENRIRSTNITNEIQYLNNYNTISRALQSMDLSSFKQKDGTDYNYLLTEENAIKKLASQVEISEIKNSNLVKISFEHPNIDFANSFLTALYKSFDATLSGMVADQLDKEQHLLEIRLAEAEQNFAASDFDREALQTDPKRAESVANRGGFQKILTFIEIKIRDVEPFAIAPGEAELLQNLDLNDPTTVRLIEEYGQAYRNLLFYELSYLARSSELENKEIPLASYRDELENKKQELVDQLVLVKGDAEAKEALIQIMNNVAYTVLTSERQYYLDKINEFSSIGLQEEKINYEFNQHKAKVLQYSNQLKNFEELRSINAHPTSLIEPIGIEDLNGNTNKTLILAVGVLLGLGLGFLAVFLYDAVSATIDNELFVKRLVGDQIPFWGIIPKIEKNKKNSNAETYILQGTRDGTLEAFNQLAGIVQYDEGAKENPMYCFSSLGYEESSITTVLNLALSIMKSGKRVLVVGANSGEVCYKEIYADVVTSDASIKTVALEENELDKVKKSSAKQPLLHLTCLSVTSDNLSLFLSSQEFAEYLSSASDAYDFVLIDGPTFQSPADLLGVATLTGGLVLHIRQGIASKKAFQQLLDTASFAQIPIRGIVFNAMCGRPTAREKHKAKVLNYKKRSEFYLSNNYSPIKLSAIVNND